jgi:ribosomal subunit interface protein
MNIQHFEKGFHYTDKDLLSIARKVGKLATYCKKIKDEGSVIRIESERRRTKKERDQVKVAITLELPKKQLRAESRRPDVVEALDRCIEKLEPQVKKYKDLHGGRSWIRRKRG